jgi:hypothetical protein
MIIIPLFPGAVYASGKDHRLYEMLALCDVMRLGTKKEIDVAVHVRRPNSMDNRIEGADVPNEYFLNVINVTSGIVPCPTDVNEDGTTNNTDFLQLLGEFNQSCD